MCAILTQISLGICPVWSVFAVSMKKAWVLSYPLSAQRRLWGRCPGWSESSLGTQSFLSWGGSISIVCSDPLNGHAEPSSDARSLALCLKFPSISYILYRQTTEALPRIANVQICFRWKAIWSGTDTMYWNPVRKNLKATWYYHMYLSLNC